MNSLKELTIVVCTKNSEFLIEDCLKEIKKSAPESELIVIDADSTDRTVKISEKYADKILSDGKKGLSYARQLGIDAASNNFVSFIGSDNVVPRKTFLDLVSELERDSDLVGVQAITIIEDPKNYWEKSTKYIFQFLFNKIGFVETIGTPCIFKKKILTEYRYDEDITLGADDTALCLKLRKANYLLKRVNAVAFEKQTLNFKSFIDRWQFYGRGDAQFYKKYSKGWTLGRKMKSIFHPAKNFLICSLLLIKNMKITILPAIFIATVARYYGWFSNIK